jgi:hypothetical protein
MKLMGQNKKSLVGKPTGRKSTAGKETYITPEGEEVSEKSVSFPIKLENKVVWVNAPSIYNGVQYSEEEVRDKINAGEVKATSVHESREEAEEAAKKRSEGLLKNYAVGGVVEDKQNKKTAEDIRKEEQLARLPDLRSPVEKSFLSSLKTENRDPNDKRRNTASIEFGDDSASVSPTVRYNENNNVQELDDGVILDEKGKRIGISLNGQVRLNEGISVRGGVEKVFSSSNTTVYKAAEVIDKFKNSNQGQTTSLGATLGNVDVDLSRSKGFNSPSRTGASIGYRGDDFNLRYSQDKQDGMPAYKNLSGNIKLGDNFNVSGGIDSNKNKNIQVNYNKKYAKGGNVEQMNKLFAEGGMMDDSGESVNGVAVPPGSLREEVADDIPAQLSEGEFVIPADVVRYIGLEKLMALRDKAKQGLQRMQEMGQMGNADEVANPDQTFASEDDDMFEQEIDDILAEEQPMPEGFARGGSVIGTDLTKAVRNPMVDVRFFRNKEGKVMFITHINGRPLVPIPEGFTETDESYEQLIGSEADKKAAEEEQEKAEELKRLAALGMSSSGDSEGGGTPTGPIGTTPNPNDRSNLITIDRAGNAVAKKVNPTLAKFAMFIPVVGPLIAKGIEKQNKNADKAADDWAAAKAAGNIFFDREQGKDGDWVDMTKAMERGYGVDVKGMPALSVKSLEPAAKQQREGYLAYDWNDILKEDMQPDLDKEQAQMEAARQTKAESDKAEAAREAQEKAAATQARADFAKAEAERQGSTSDRNGGGDFSMDDGSGGYGKEDAAGNMAKGGMVKKRPAKAKPTKKGLASKRK